MSRGEMFQEFEEKRRKEGFFAQLYKGVCTAMGEENIDKLVYIISCLCFDKMAIMILVGNIA